MAGEARPTEADGHVPPDTLPCELERVAYIRTLDGDFFLRRHGRWDRERLGQDQLPPSGTRPAPPGDTEVSALIAGLGSPSAEARQRVADELARIEALYGCVSWSDDSINRRYAIALEKCRLTGRL